jgi:hypothetical protein
MQFAAAAQIVAVGSDAEPASAVEVRSILAQLTAVADAVAMVELVGGTRNVAAELAAAEAPNKFEKINDFQNGWNNNYANVAKIKLKFLNFIHSFV